MTDTMSGGIPLHYERVHLRCPNINIGFHARLTPAGSVTPDAVRTAIDCVTTRHPLLTATVHTRDTDDFAWFALSPPVPVGLEIREAAAVDLIDWQAWYSAQDNVPFDVAAGPLINFRVTLAPGAVDIAIIGHHILGDGIAYCIMVRDLLSALDSAISAGNSGSISEAFLGEKQLLPLDNTLIHNPGLNIFESYFTRAVSREWRRHSYRTPAAEYERIFDRYRASSAPKIHTAILDTAALKSLHAACKASGITVNEAIASAFALALSKENGYRRRLTIGVVANIRNEFVVKRDTCMGNYFTAVCINFLPNFRKTFFANAALLASRLRKKFSQLRTRYRMINFLDTAASGLIDSVMIIAYGDHRSGGLSRIKNLIGKKLGAVDIGVSNLGRQTIGPAMNYTVDAMDFVPPAFPATTVNIGVLTASDREDAPLHLCIHYAQSKITGSVISALTVDAIAILKNVVNHSNVTD